METVSVRSGLETLDKVLQELRLGDNVVWQVDGLDDYRYFAEPFATEAIAQGHDVVYLRFAPHSPVLTPRSGLTTIQIDPSPGFDYSSRALNGIIEDRGPEVFYIFDSLSTLVESWATDELLANLFQVTCPYLSELDTVAYFALQRGQHAHSAVARIRDTTQVLIDVYHVKDQMYIHPLKVWDRYSPHMFLPHLLAGQNWVPIFTSGDAAEVTATAHRKPLQATVTSIAPWESVYRKLVKHRDIGQDALATNAELLALKQELCRIMIGDHFEFNRLADRYLTLGDLIGIRDRLVGSGRIGGKAAGMLLARRILLTREDGDEMDFEQVLEAHDSFYIGSDVFFTFLVHNDLFRLRLQLTRNAQLSREEFEEVQQRFLAAQFPTAIIEQFTDMLDYFGQAPIIVRSSSLLEDSFGNAFAGKYRSEFCANQGNPEERMEEFLGAVKLVYASAVNPDALSYRRKRGLGETDEQMAILVQRVSGMPLGQFFLPTLAGVAFSRNLYAWNDRIDPNQGMIRLVFGLGTRAVERVGADYPRMIAVSHPQLRPEMGPKVAKYSQRDVDLLDLGANKLVTLPVEEVLSTTPPPDLHLLVSVMRDGYPYDPVSRYIEGSPHQFVLTFGNLVHKTKLVDVIGAMLAKLDRAYGGPLDTEFTAHVRPSGEVRVNLLQCRPLLVPGSAATVSVHPSPEQVLFRSSRVCGGGMIRDVRYVVYIDPRHYSLIKDQAIKKSLGRVIGRINEHSAIVEGKVMLVGPGRWGSSNIGLGVNVSYGDIDNAAVLVEIASEEAGQFPEVSYGTHFFQDLVESQVVYVAVYPCDPDSSFNSSFFENSPNALRDLWPNAGDFEDLVQVIDVPRVANGAHVHIVASPQTRTAICFLE